MKHKDGLLNQIEQPATEYCEVTEEDLLEIAKQAMGKYEEVVVGYHVGGPLNGVPIYDLRRKKK